MKRGGGRGGEGRMGREEGRRGRERGGREEGGGGGGGGGVRVIWSNSPFFISLRAFFDFSKNMVPSLLVRSK